MLPEARRNNVGVLAKRSIADAPWKPAAERRGIHVNYATTYAERLAKMAITPANLGFPGEVGTARAEIAPRFTLSRPGVATAIVNTTKASNLERNLKALSKGALPDDVVSELRSAFRRAGAASGGPWPARA